MLFPDGNTTRDNDCSHNVDIQDTDVVVPGIPPEYDVPRGRQGGLGVL